MPKAVFSTSFAHFKQLIHHLLLTLHVPREQNDHSRPSELMFLSKIIPLISVLEIQYEPPFEQT